MRQAVHIFEKDVRRLRYSIAAVLLLTAAFAWTEGHTGPLYGLKYEQLAQMAGTLKPLVVLAWWYLVAQAVFGEPLLGDRQFWLTRPYHWASLLGAKLLFVAAFINLPLLLSDCAIVALQRSNPFAYPAALAWHQLSVCAILLLPMMALACLTKGLAQLVLVVLSIPISLVLLEALLFGGHGIAMPEVEWIYFLFAGAILFVASIIVLVAQYRTRRRWPARIVAVLAGILLVRGFYVVPFSKGLALQSKLLGSQVDTSSVSLAVEAGNTRPLMPGQLPNGVVMPTDTVRIALPIAFVGLPSGTVPAIEAMWVQLSPPDDHPVTFGVQTSQTGPQSYTVSLDRATLDRLKSTPLRMHVTAYATLFGDARTETMPLEAGPYRVPRLGFCRAAWEAPIRLVPGEGFPLTCAAPFRQPARELASLEGGEENARPMGMDLYSPFPAEFGIGPIATSNWQLKYEANARSVVFTTMKALAHIRRDLDIPNVRLGELPQQR
jgi:hypothetical protein